MNIYVDSKRTDDNRRRELYQGALFIHSPSPSALKLCQLAQELIKDAFGSVDPVTVQETLPAEKCAEILAVLKPKFIHHPKAKEYLAKMLSELGCDLEKTYFDVPRMRTAFPGGLSEIRYCLCVSSSSGHLVFGAFLPNKLVDAHLRNQGR